MKTEPTEEKAKEKKQAWVITLVSEAMLRDKIKDAIARGVKKLYVDKNCEFLENKPAAPREWWLLADLEPIARHAEGKRSKWRETELNFEIRQAINEFLENVDAQCSPFWEEYRRKEGGFIFLYHRRGEN